MEVFDEMRAGVASDCSQFYKDRSAACYGANRPGSKVSPGRPGRVWTVVHAGRPQGRLRLHQGFSKTALTKDLEKIDVPTLITHGDDDQIVPMGRFRYAVLEDRQGRRVYPVRPTALRPHTRISRTRTCSPSSRPEDARGAGAAAKRARARLAFTAETYRAARRSGAPHTRPTKS
jgi:hypothetical protein